MTKRVFADLDGELHEHLREYSFRNKVAIKTIITELLTDFLEKVEQSKTKPKIINKKRKG